MLQQSSTTSSCHSPGCGVRPVREWTTTRSVARRALESLSDTTAIGKGHCSWSCASRGENCMAVATHWGVLYSRDAPLAPKSPLQRRALGEASALARNKNNIRSHSPGELLEEVYGMVQANSSAT
eukprot:8411047-Pyramimonas_sp.AAC.1